MQSKFVIKKAMNMLMWLSTVGFCKYYLNENKWMKWIIFFFILTIL